MIKLIASRIEFIFLKATRLYVFTFSIFFILGVVFNNYFNFVLIFAAVSFCFFILTRKKVLLIFSFYFLGYIFGSLRFQQFQSLYENSYMKSLWGKEITLEGSIASEPNIKGVTSEYIFTPDLNRDKLNVNNLSHSTYGKVLLKLPRYPQYYYGDKVRVSGLMEEPGEFEAFSYTEYLKTQGIVATTKPYTVKIGERGNWFLMKISEFKSSLRVKVKSALGEPHATLMLGILIGYKSGMPQAFSDALSATGTTHIVAASGYNVTVVLASLSPLQNVLGRKRLFYFSIISLTIFALIVGLENIPALRAAVMGYIYLFAKNIGRKGHIISILTFTAAFFVFLNPFVIKSLSYQLSFLSTYGLIILSEKLEGLLKLVPEIIRKELTPTLSATLATAPVTIANFGKISSISLIVNLLVLPTVPLTMFLGAISSFALVIDEKLGNIVSFIVYFPLEYMIEMISWFGNLDFAVVGIAWDWRLTLLIYAIFIIIFIQSDFNKYRRRYEKN